MSELYCGDGDIYTGAISNIVSQDRSSFTVGDDTSDDAEISSDDKFVVFESYATNLDTVTNGRNNIMLYEKATNDILNITDDADEHSFNPSVSNDGEWIVFESTATTW